jgi:hypothetical protein
MFLQKKNKKTANCGGFDITNTYPTVSVQSVGIVGWIDLPKI